MTTQYQGILPDDERLAPYWALAEELDIPVGIHVGTGPPGVIYLGASAYRARMHSALTMEEVLAKHPQPRDVRIGPDGLARGHRACDCSDREAPFLSEAQKRDILYNNAARFLRLNAEEIARHHGVASGPAAGREVNR